MVSYDLICSILYISNKYEELLQMHITNVCLPLTTSVLYRPLFRLFSCFLILFSSQVEDKIETKKSVKAILQWGFLTIRSTLITFIHWEKKEHCLTKGTNLHTDLDFLARVLRDFSIGSRKIEKAFS